MPMAAVLSGMQTGPGFAGLGQLGLIANMTNFSGLSTTPATDEEEDDADNPIKLPAVQTFFCVLYTTIFVLGVFGNVLVCYVVGRNRAMQTVTNFFITNLALSDILLCILAVPFTPLYSFLGQWVFGQLMCHLVTYAQGTSVYISTLTLTSIAIDRYFVIIYPFQPRMRQSTCLWIILGIWTFSLVVTIPYGLYMSYNTYNETYNNHSFCEEAWPSENFRQIYSGMTTVLQFLVPLVVIAFCYIRVSVRLSDHARLKPGCKSSRKEEADRERKRRTNRMLIAMVTVFGMSWMPLNVINLVNDIHMAFGNWKYYNLVFFMVHALAMSSTCYNPFLYAWLNDNFRKEFKQVLPCFIRFGLSQPGCPSATTTQTTVPAWRSEAVTCNGGHGGVGAPPRSASARAEARAEARTNHDHGPDVHDALLPSALKAPRRRRNEDAADVNGADGAKAATTPPANAPAPARAGCYGQQGQGLSSAGLNQLRGKRKDPSASSPTTEAVSWTGAGLVTATYSTEDGSVEVHLPLEAVASSVGAPAVAPPERPLISISPEGSPRNKTAAGNGTGPTGSVSRDPSLAPTPGHGTQADGGLRLGSVA